MSSMNSINDIDRKISDIIKQVSFINFNTAIAKTTLFYSSDSESITEVEDVDYKEVLDSFIKLKAVAEEKRIMFRKLADEDTKKIMSVELAMSEKYTLLDNTANEKKSLSAELASLDVRFNTCNNSIHKYQNERVQYQKEKEKANREKGEFRWEYLIPFYNIGYLIDRIEGLDRDIERCEKSAKDLSEALRKLENEQRVTGKALSEVEKKLSDLSNKVSVLEAERKVLQKERELKKQDSIEWQNRSLYCGELAARLAMLISIEAPSSDFKKLFQDNPPPFDMKKYLGTAI